MWETGQILLEVNREDISYLRFIFEGYDGLGIVTTRDAFSAEVTVTYPLSRRPLLDQLVQALRREGVVRKKEDRQ
jgi:hypothetical protein